MKITRGLRQLGAGIALATAMAVWTPGATAASGSIRAGHPETVVTAGVTEAAFVNAPNRCATIPAATQGVDGYVIDLGTNNTLELTSTSPLGNTHSLNFVFYNSNCNDIAVYLGLNSARKSWPLSKVPATSRWLVVSGVYGANISLSYTLSTTP